MKLRIIFLIGMVVMMAMPISASVFDDAGILDENFLNKTMMFENDTRATLAVVTLAQADDIDAKAEEYFNRTDSDIIILYDVKNNKIAIARPSARQSLLSDADIESLLGERYDQKQNIATDQDASEYIGNIIDDLSNLLMQNSANEFNSRMSVISICSSIKDGVCNQSCSGDLDCECDDGICEYHENYLTCSQDCKMTENYDCMYITDGYCDRNCPGIDIDCPIDYTSPDYMQGKATLDSLELALIAMLVVIIGILIYVYMLTKRG